MNLEKIKYVCETMEEDILLLPCLSNKILPRWPFPEGTDWITSNLRLRFDHLLYMLNEIPKMYSEGHTEKAMRWLGFVQGVVLSLGVYRTISELKDMNKS